MSWHSLPESLTIAGEFFTFQLFILKTARFFEFKALFGGNLICGFGRLYGQLTGFLVNSGPITAGDSQKGGHFVQVRNWLNLDKNLNYSLNSFVTIETSHWFSFKMAGN